MPPLHCGVMEGLGLEGISRLILPFFPGFGEFLVFVPMIVLALRGHCHKEQSCDLSPVPDRKKQIITQLRGCLRQLSLLVAFFPWQICRSSVNWQRSFPHFRAR